MMYIGDKGREVYTTFEWAPATGSSIFTDFQFSLTHAPHIHPPITYRKYKNIIKQYRTRWILHYHHPRDESFSPGWVLCAPYGKIRWHHILLLTTHCIIKLIEIKGRVRIVEEKYFTLSKQKYMLIKEPSNFNTVEVNKYSTTHKDIRTMAERNHTPLDSACYLKNNENSSWWQWSWKIDFSRQLHHWRFALLWWLATTQPNSNSTWTAKY